MDPRDSIPGGTLVIGARRANDADMIDKVAELLGELREAWAEVASGAGA